MIANINLHKSSTGHLCAGSHRFRDTHISKFVTWKMYVKVMMYNIRSGKYMTSYLMAIVMFALYLTVCKILDKQEKCQKFDFENEGQDHGVGDRDLRHLTGNVRVHKVDFFSRILATWEYTFTKTYTPT